MSKKLNSKNPVNCLGVNVIWILGEEDWNYLKTRTLWEAHRLCDATDDGRSYMNVYRLSNDGSKMGLDLMLHIFTSALRLGWWPDGSTSLAITSYCPSFANFGLSMPWFRPQASRNKGLARCLPSEVNFDPVGTQYGYSCSYVVVSMVHS